MVEARFSKDMISILSSCKDKKLVSYESEAPSEVGGVYGNMRLNFDGFSLEIVNEEQSMPMFNEQEDVACISCSKVDTSAPFEPMVVTDVVKTSVGHVVEAIDVITDTIDVNDGEYQIAFDMAVIFHMENAILMVSRDVWFSEMLTIRDNERFDEVFPVDEVIESWSNDGEYHVSVKRTKTSL